MIMISLNGYANRSGSHYLFFGQSKKMRERESERESISMKWTLYKDVGDFKTPF